MDDERELVANRLKRLTETIAGLRLEVEGWRKHTGSTGYFLQVALEDLIKAVHELADYIQANKR